MTIKLVMRYPTKITLTFHYYSHHLVSITKQAVSPCEAMQIISSVFVNL